MISFRACRKLLSRKVLGISGVSGATGPSSTALLAGATSGLGLVAFAISWTSRAGGSAVAVIDVLSSTPAGGARVSETGIVLGALIACLDVQGSDVCSLTESRAADTQRSAVSRYVSDID